MNGWMHRVLDWAFPARKEADRKTEEAKVAVESVISELRTLNHELGLRRFLEMERAMNETPQEPKEEVRPDA